MNFTVEILFNGFAGSVINGVLGIGTWAVIRTPDRKNVLLDAGGVMFRGSIMKLLAEHDLTPEDVDAVLLTHAHFDHAYNLDLFPGAKVYMHRAEWENLTKIPRDPYCVESAIPVLRSCDLTLLEEEEGEILPGISYLHTPGHTPGSVSFVLDQGEEGKWVLTGDACKNRGELRSLEVMMTQDPENSSASLRKIKRVASRVLPGHDGWLTIKDGEVIPEGGNDLHIRFTQGITVNGGQTEIVLHMD